MQTHQQIIRQRNYYPVNLEYAAVPNTQQALPVPVPVHANAAGHAIRK